MKKHYLLLFKSELFTVAAELNALEHTQSEVVAKARPRIESLNNIILNQFGISGLLETQNELYGAIFCFVFVLLFIMF